MPVGNTGLPFWVCFVLSCFGLQCLKPDLQDLDFFSVDTNAYSVIGLDSFQANGILTGLVKIRAETCGFVWSDDLSAITGPNPAGNTTVAGHDVGNGLFMTKLPAKRGGVIYFRAFARHGARQVYSLTIESFALGNIVEITGNATVENQTAVVFGLLSGIKLPLETYGHVYSAGNPLPEIEAPGCDTVSLGPTNDDGLYQSSLDSLEFNTTYYVRAYAISQGKPFYSQAVGTFTTGDGWEQIQYFPTTYQAGLAAVDPLREKAFAAFGCKMEGGCKASQLSSEMWEFDGVDTAGWSAIMPAGSVTERTNSSGFIIGDTLYVLFGEQTGDLGGEFTLLSFRKFYLPTMTWLLPPPPPPAGMLPRTGAAVFVLAGKGYAGTGRNVDVAFNATWLSDFWEYNPGTGAWRKVASLPAQGPPGLPDNGGSREEAAVFNFSESAVVGGGKRGVLYLRDFWKFTPPQSPQDTGKWTPVKSFPGTGRIQAVSFAIDDRGYYGTGYNDEPNFGYFDDWWEYRPDTDNWIPRTRFQGPRRRHGMGFALKENGYLFTGIGRVVQNDIPTQVIMADGWKYVPIKK